MNKHIWTDRTTDTTFVLHPAVAATPTKLERDRSTGDPALDADIERGAMRREVLRLAKREADLLAAANETLSILGAAQPPLEQAVHVLASEARRRDFDLAAAKRANEILGGKVNGLEEELRSLNATALVRRAEGLEAGVRRAIADAERAQSRADAFQRALKAAEARITALERENREKTLELAEKAGRIRELEADLALRDVQNGQQVRRIASLEAESGERNAEARELEESLKAANEENNLLARKHPVIVRLQAAIEDGIAHVERARQVILTNRGGVYLSVDRDTLEQLDLAHEALSAAVRVDRGGAAPRVETAPAGPTLNPETAASLERVKDLLDDLAAKREPGFAARLESLEESRGHHAVLLTDHADRLKALEALDLAITRSVVDGLHHAGCRRADEIAALEERVQSLEVNQGEPAWTKSDLDALARRLCAMEEGVQRLNGWVNDIRGRQMIDAALEAGKE